MMDAEAQDQLLQHRQVWERKPTLRRIYREQFFARMLAQRRNTGVSVEIGGGPGYFKEFFPDLVSTDVVWCPWLDVVADAQRLPFKGSTVGNLFGLDVLHHLAVPMEFLQEVQRILVPGGRLILIEPWVTPFSFLIYRYLHQEDCNLSARPWEARQDLSVLEKKAFDGNQAIPYLLFSRRHLKRVTDTVPKLSPILIESFSLFAYLLSCGFKPMNLLPGSLYPAVAKLEQATSVLWRPLAALRVLIVMEKTH